MPLSLPGLSMAAPCFHAARVFWGHVVTRTVGLQPLQLLPHMLPEDKQGMHTGTKVP